MVWFDKRMCARRYGASIFRELLLILPRAKHTTDNKLIINF